MVIYTTSIESGYPVLDDEEEWGRINILKAGNGYSSLLNDTVVEMNSANGGFNSKDNWLNDIDGNGKLTKRGSGTLVLTGTNSYSGGTLIEGGCLTVTNKNSLGSGNVENSSILQEEVSGSVDIKKGFTQTSEGTLGLLISSSEDVINVNGEANLGGTIKVTFDNFTPTSQITLIKASKINGTFENTASVDGEIKYTNNEVIFIPKN